MRELKRHRSKKVGCGAFQRSGPRFFSHLVVLSLDSVEFLFLQILRIDQFPTRSLCDTEKLIQLELPPIYADRFSSGAVQSADGRSSLLGLFGRLSKAQ